MRKKRKAGMIKIFFVAMRSRNSSLAAMRSHTDAANWSGFVASGMHTPCFWLDVNGFGRSRLRPGNRNVRILQRERGGCIYLVRRQEGVGREGVPPVD